MGRKSSWTNIFLSAPLLSSLSLLSSLPSLPSLLPSPSLSSSLLLCVFPPGGFDRVFPMEKLQTFQPEEAQLLLCGEQSPSWTRDDILNYTEPKYGYTRTRSAAKLHQVTGSP